MHEIMSIFKIGAHISCEITGLTLGTPVKRQETKITSKMFCKNLHLSSCYVKASLQKNEVQSTE